MEGHVASSYTIGMDISKEDQSYLLSLARRSIAERFPQEVGGGGAEPLPPRPKGGEKSIAELPCGAFVTLHSGKNLRGCIGRMSAAGPLRETIRHMAQAAAFEDPRFPPLAREELQRCRIEISVLSPMEPCPDPRSVRVGVHGLYLAHRGRSGVLLPQVPQEQGWDLDEYLDYICRKAGLPPKSYEESGAQLYTFTAQVFSEQ